MSNAKKVPRASFWRRLVAVLGGINGRMERAKVRRSLAVLCPKEPWQSRDFLALGMILFGREFASREPSLRALLRSENRGAK